MSEMIKILSTTFNEILSDTVETLVKNVVKHCSGEEFSSVSPLVDYILSHPEYELNVISTSPPDSTVMYKVSYKGKEMASCIMSYYFDSCNLGKIVFNIGTIYSYDENKNSFEKIEKMLLKDYGIMGGFNYD